MTGSVRSVLTDTLAAHDFIPHAMKCRCGWNYGKEPHAEHVADVLLGLSGVAVTQLPEPNPNGVRRHPSWRVIVDGEPEDVYVRREKNEPEIEVVVSGVASLTMAEADNLAASLLAASRVAEQHQDPAVYPICPECGGRHPFMGTCIACEREHCNCHTDEQHQDQT